MGKKRKKKKNRAGKRRQAILKNLPVPQLLQRGSDFLNTAKPREAIPLLKAAFKTGSADDEVRSLLFQAYKLRAIHSGIYEGGC